MGERMGVCVWSKAMGLGIYGVWDGSQFMYK